MTSTSRTGWVRIALSMLTFALTQRALAQTGDFNGDGVDDLVIGVPHEDWNNLADSGVVQIIYGVTGVGLDACGPPGPADQLLRQGALVGSFTICGATAAGDLFGAAFAPGDFNGDGFDDLAIGVPGDDIQLPTGPLAADAGSVVVLHGGPMGLNTGVLAPQCWDQNGSILDSPQSGDQFGFDVAAGDFNCDGFEDLAIGVPNETTTATQDGAINVIYGGPNGLSSGGGAIPTNQFWHQGVGSFPGSPGAFDNFGMVLDVGQLDGVGGEDLAIGIPREDPGGLQNAGMVQIMYGSPCGQRGGSGLSDSAVAELVACPPTAGDGFGSGVEASGDFDARDFDGNGIDDCVVGAHLDNIGAVADAGSVSVFYNNSTTCDVWHQNRASVAGACEVNDHFGFELTVGDFDGNGADDLAIGVPDENWEGVAATGSCPAGDFTDAGAVHVIYGVVDVGLQATGTGCPPNDQLWRQGKSGVSGCPAIGDKFGYELVTGDFNGDGIDDLSISAPFDSTDAGGTVHIIYGVDLLGCVAGDGLDATPPATSGVPPDMTFSQNSTCVENAAETGDRFGEGKD